MSELDIERKKYQVFKEMVATYKKELLEDREYALSMPIETENGFNIEREQKIEDIDEKLTILSRHVEDPYFAKLVFQDLDDGMEFKGYIGRVSIGDVGDKTDQKIIDWRAPISDLYYNGRVGETEYSALGKTYRVNLNLKRQIKIKDDNVADIYDFEDGISSDEFLVPYLTQSADNRLKSIVSTIQKEQNDIIRKSPFENLIVQGVAGSGKTTVALHRLSYVMYNYKKTLRPEQLLIISPNDIFLSYISSILVDLDSDRSSSFSINNMLENLLGKVTLKDKHYQYEYLTKKKVSTDYLSFKNSYDFASLMEKFIVDYKNTLCNKPLVLSGIEVLGKEDVSRFFEDNRQTNITTLINNGCKKLGMNLSVFGSLKDKALSNVAFAKAEVKAKNSVKSKIESGNYGYIKQFIKTNFDILKIYTEFIKSLDKYCDYKDIEVLQKYTLDNLKKKVVTYDDYAPILYMVARFIELPYYDKLKCVFIDEAQDLSELMFLALRKIFRNANFSIFGDIAQGIYSYQSISAWSDIEKLFEDSKYLLLNRSYRTSVEIMVEANKELAKLGVEQANNVVRHGEEVVFTDNSLDTITKVVSECLPKYKSVAIICKDTAELEVAKEKLSPLGLMVLGENNKYYDGQDKLLMTVHTAKGLEFDAVIIYNNNSYSDSSIDLKQLYVAKTRALHKLVVCSGK